MHGLISLVAVAALLATAATSFSIDKQLPHKTYGEVILSGGYDGNDIIATVEVIGTDFLPPLPVPLTGPSLTFMGSVLYCCGGYYIQDMTNCYTLNTSATDPQWDHTLDLPEAMIHQTATAIGTHIWFIYDGFVYDLDTQSGQFQMQSTPFIVHEGHCAVAYGGFTYVIGVGVRKNEVWVNTKESDPTEWEQTMVLISPKEDSACLLFDSKIFITGGKASVPEVDVIDVLTNTVTKTGPLQENRYYHGSFVLDGKPTVAGGYYNGVISSMESYDEFTNKWQTIERKLEGARDSFGVAQFVQ